MKVICPHAKVCSQHDCKDWVVGGHFTPHEQNGVCKGITCNEFNNAQCVPYEEKKEVSKYRRIEL